MHKNHTYNSASIQSMKGSFRRDSDYFLDSVDCTIFEYTPQLEEMRENDLHKIRESFSTNVF